MKITIKKESEEITYKNITTTHTFNVNGKEVNVYEWDKYDSIGNDYDSGTEVEEADLEKLTDLEHEVFGENLNEWLELKVGKSKTEEIDEA